MVFNERTLLNTMAVGRGEFQDINAPAATYEPGWPCDQCGSVETGNR
jgi:hypothetical protein